MRKDSWWEDIWAHTCIAAILAGSKSPNQRPRGHNRLSTCPAMYQSINLSSCWLTTYIVCVFWIFPRWCCAVLEVWDGFLTGGPKLLEGMAGEGKHCLTRCAQRCEGRRRRAKNRNREKRRQWEKKKVRVTDFCVRHAALQASGRWLIQHDDEPWWINTTQRPVPPRGCSHQSWVKGGGGNSPRLLVDTEPRWREDTWGICLFISSHMLYPLQCYSESAQWGIRWTLHQLSEDGRAFLPQEQLTQTRSIESGPLEGFGWEKKAFLAFHSRLVDLCCSLFLFFYPPSKSSLHNAETE